MTLLAVAVFALAGAAAAGPVRTVPLSREAAAKPIRIQCPVGERTLLVLPNPLLVLRASPGASQDLGVTAEKSRPLGVIALKPVKLARGRLEATGPGASLVLLVESVSTGVGSEVRLTWAEPTATATLREDRPKAVPQAAKASPPAAGPAPAPTVVIDRSPTAPEATQLPVGLPSVTPTSPMPVAAAPVVPSPTLAAEPATIVDQKAFRAATPRLIERREGLPGEPEMVLRSAAADQNLVWLEFLLMGGSGNHVESVLVDRQRVVAFRQEPQGKDLRLLVQLPRARVTPRTRAVVKVPAGGTYSFALNSGTFADFLKGLFQ